MRTSGAGNEHFMTWAILGIALATSMVLFGGPAEFATYADRYVHDALDAGLAMIRSR